MNPRGRSSVEEPRSGSGGYRGAMPRQDDFIERLAWLMDRSIPVGGGYSIGLDPIIGLVPGIGDFIGTAISSMIVFEAYRRGIPKPTVLRMVANVGIDAVLGAVPFLGDLFDFAFKANVKNLELYREAIAGVRDTRRDTRFLVGLAALVGILLAIPVLLIAWAVQYILPALT